MIPRDSYYMHPLSSQRNFSVGDILCSNQLKEHKPEAEVIAVEPNEVTLHFFDPDIPDGSFNPNMNHFWIVISPSESNQL